jgi:hypothetical protein
MTVPDCQAAGPIRGLPQGHSASRQVRLPEGELLQAVGAEGQVLPGPQALRPGRQVLPTGHAGAQGVQSQVAPIR